MAMLTDTPWESQAAQGRGGRVAAVGLSSFPGPLAAVGTCLCPPGSLPSSPGSTGHMAMHGRGSREALTGQSPPLPPLVLVTAPEVAGD